jgi:hypothetical protein
MRVSASSVSALDHSRDGFTRRRYLQSRVECSHAHSDGAERASFLPSQRNTSHRDTVPRASRFARYRLGDLPSVGSSGSRIAASSFSGLFTRVDIGHIFICPGRGPADRADQARYRRATVRRLGLPGYGSSDCQLDTAKTGGWRIVERALHGHGGKARSICMICGVPSIEPSRTICATTRAPAAAPTKGTAMLASARLKVPQPSKARVCAW